MSTAAELMAAINRVLQLATQLVNETASDRVTIANMTRELNDRDLRRAAEASRRNQEDK